MNGVKRMRFGGDPDVESEDLLNLTSMIDVVFTLLAFFIITVRVFSAERDAVVAPSGPPGAPGIVRGDLPEQITIGLAGAADGRMRILIGGHEFSEPAAIMRQLQEINLPQVQVVFAASEDLTVDQVASAVDAALHSPMKKVSLRRATAGELALASTPEGGT